MLLNLRITYPAGFKPSPSLYSLFWLIRASKSVEEGMRSHSWN